MVALTGAGPLEFSASTLPVLFIDTKANKSPPGPLVSGLTTAETNAAASTASTALPPSWRILTPANDANAWPEETMPCWLMTDRPSCFGEFHAAPIPRMRAALPPRIFSLSAAFSSRPSMAFKLFLTSTQPSSGPYG